MKYFFKSNQLIYNPIYDFFLVCLPIWVPITYIFNIYYFHEYNPIIFFIYLFLLGETHFGATWLFFSHKGSLSWVKTKKYELIFIPALILISTFIIGLKSIELILLLILIFNFWHVTSQSIGIIKIYKNNIQSIKIECSIIYILNFFCAVIGILKFIFLFEFIENYIPIISLIVFIIIVAYIIFAIFKVFINSNPYFIAASFTGMIMYLPFLYADTIQNAFMIGIGMHYSQYLALTLPINIRRKSDFKNNLSEKSDIIIIILYLFFYSIVMVLFTLSKSKINYFYLIPISFQLAHFYIEGFLWKFSDKYIRHNVGNYLFKQ